MVTCRAVGRVCALRLTFLEIATRLAIFGLALLKTRPRLLEGTIAKPYPRADLVP